MSILIAAVLIVAILVGLAFALSPRAEIVTEVEIDAKPVAVWSLLGNPQSYAEWNPFIVSIEGDLIKGSTLVNTIRSQAGRKMTFKPTVLKAEPAKELRWFGRLFLPKIFDGEHYFLLEERDGGTRLVHGERFHGLLLWFIDPARFEADFEKTNAALKAHAENASDDRD